MKKLFTLLLFLSLFSCNYSIAQSECFPSYSLTFTTTGSSGGNCDLDLQISWVQGGLTEQFEWNVSTFCSGLEVISGMLSGSTTVSCTLPCNTIQTLSIQSYNDQGEECSYVEIEISVPLPVDLVSFSGRSTASGNELKWSTASEENNSGFIPQYSPDAITFFDLDFVPGNGTTATENNYTTLHRSELYNTYYRLKQIDYDGAYEYSSIISVIDVNNNTELTVQPSPATDYINLVIDSNKKSEYYLYNISNGVTEAFGEFVGSTTINLYNIPAGFYTIQVITEGRSIYKKITVVRDRT